MARALAFTWQLTEIHGWGLVGVHTALYLVDQGEPPLLLEKPVLSSLRPRNRERLEGLLGPYEQAAAFAARNPDRVLKLAGLDVLHALSNGFHAGPASARFRGERDIGVIAYEDTRLTAEVLERARPYRRIIVHSTFNKALLETKGFVNVGLAFQGIDETEMQPLPPAGRFPGRFAIFSGGKLEFRKGQDIVLAAFRIFRERHPEALLVTAWQNVWAHLALSMGESAHTPVPPRIDGQSRVMIAAWAADNGVPADAFVDLGFLRREQIAPVLADCQAAVFPNRCEGATNLVAMEAMACGVPCVLSANTGHLDLMHGDVCFPLTEQAAVPDPDGSRIGWGESSVEEVVDRLEAIHADRERARRKAEEALAFVRRERTWRAFAEAFVREIRIGD